MKRRKKFEILSHGIINLKYFTVVYHRRSFLNNGLKSYSLLRQHSKSMKTIQKAIHPTLQITNILSPQTSLQVYKHMLWVNVISVTSAMKLLTISALFEDLHQSHLLWEQKDALQTRTKLRWICNMLQSFPKQYLEVVKISGHGWLSLQVIWLNHRKPNFAFTTYETY